MSAETETRRPPTIVSTKEILEILPHRHPFLFVDRIIHLDIDQNEIVGEKCVSVNEPFFQGHFPGLPIMPGVLILEALAQTGGILAYKKGYIDQIAVFMSLNGVKFRRPVYPGDVLNLRITGVIFSSKAGRVKGMATVEGQPVAEAEIGFAFVKRELL